MVMQVHELEGRLTEGSQRVMELQGLVGELEGRLASEHSLPYTSLEEGGGHTPSPSHQVQSFISELTLKLFNYHLQKHLQSPPPPISPSLGQRIKEALYHTKQAVSQKNWPQLQQEIAVLESLLTELLGDQVPSRSISPPGLVVSEDVVLPASG